MIRYVTSLIALTLFGAALAQGPPKLAPPKSGDCKCGDACKCEPKCECGAACVEKKTRAASVRVEVANPENTGANYVGSGTVVKVENGKATILTNRHVAPSEGRGITISWPDGKTAKAKIVTHHPIADVARLECDAPEGCVAVSVAKDKPADNATVIQWGYTKGARQPVRRIGRALRRMLSYRNNNPADPVFSVAMTTDHGDSGSGVFNENGELVAIVWGGLPENTSCVDLDNIRAILTASAASSTSDTGSSTWTITVNETNRLRNRSGSQCAWVVTETLCRQAGLTAAVGMSERHPESVGHPSIVANELRRRGIECRIQSQGDKNPQILADACAKHGAAIGLGGQHVIALVGWDTDKRTVNVIDNSGPQAGQVQTWTWDRCYSAWDGWTLVPLAQHAPAETPMNRPGAPMPKPEVIPPKPANIVPVPSAIYWPRFDPAAYNVPQGSPCSNGNCRR